MQEVNSCSTYQQQVTPNLLSDCNLSAEHRSLTRNSPHQTEDISLSDADASDLSATKESDEDNSKGEDIEDAAVDPTKPTDEDSDKKATGKSSNVRPPFSYIALITMALKSVDNNMMTLNDIYEYIMDKFPYFKKNLSRWQNSIRHNLSLNDCFVRVAKPHGQRGKGNFWTLHPKCGNMFSNGSFLRRPKRFRASTTNSQQAAHVQHVDSVNHFSLFRPCAPPAGCEHSPPYYQQPPCAAAYNATSSYGSAVTPLRSQSHVPIMTRDNNAYWPQYGTTMDPGARSRHNYSLPNSPAYSNTSANTMPSYYLGATPTADSQTVPSLPNNAYPAFQRYPPYPVPAPGGYTPFGYPEGLYQR